MCACFLIYLHLFIHVAVIARSQIIQTSDTFDLLLTSGSLSIQNEQEFVTFAVVSGTWNGSQASLDVDTSNGHLTFYSNDSCSLEMQITTDRTINVVVSGVSISALNETAFTITITTGQDVAISWGYNLESYTDEYTVLAFGLVGIGMMVFSPAWTIRKVLNEGVDVDSVEGIGYAVLIFIIGLGLFITFLYW